MNQSTGVTCQNAFIKFPRWKFIKMPLLNFQDGREQIS